MARLSRLPSSPLLVLRRALDRLVDFLDRALDLGIVELVRRLGAERAGLDRRREDRFAERLRRNRTGPVAVLGAFPLDGEQRDVVALRAAVAQRLLDQL